MALCISQGQASTTQRRTRLWSAALGLSMPVSNLLPRLLLKRKPCWRVQLTLVETSGRMSRTSAFTSSVSGFQCSKGRRVVKFELEKTEYALFPSLIHQDGFSMHMYGAESRSRETVMDTIFSPPMWRERTIRKISNPISWDWRDSTISRDTWWSSLQDLARLGLRWLMSRMVTIHWSKI